MLVTRAVRSFAYGALAVAFAQALTSRGFDPFAVGAAIAGALVAGAVFSAFTGRLVRAFGAARTFAAGGILMIAAALLLAGNAFAVAAACALGVVSPGGQDVGPFAAVEQTTLGAQPGVARRLGWYNVVAAAAAALGALAAAVLPYAGVLAAYAAAGAVVVVIAPRVTDVAPPPAAALEPAARGVVERLAALFAVDAFAGGFVVQAFIAYWFELRFGVGAAVVGPLLAAANVLAAASLLLAGPIASRIGLLNTMVFTHLPSNVLLLLVPFMPTFESAAGVLLARFALSQMDVPTRQAYTLALVPAHDRARAAGITSAVRPAAASAAPLLAGVALQFAAAGVPFVAAGVLKIVYDLALFATFRKRAREAG